MLFRSAIREQRYARFFSSLLSDIDAFLQILRSCCQSSVCVSVGRGSAQFSQCKLRAHGSRTCAAAYSCLCEFNLGLYGFAEFSRARMLTLNCQILAFTVPRAAIQLSQDRSHLLVLLETLMVMCIEALVSMLHARVKNGKGL